MNANPRLRSAAALFAVLLALGIGSPAAAATNAQKLAALANFTQTSASSYNAWNGARLNQGAWADYRFNWSTDYCSSSPDNPLGFNFTLSCYRHDFGYRNYKEMAPVPDEQGPGRQRLLRRPAARLRHVQRLDPARLRQPGLDLLPGRTGLRRGRRQPGRPRPGRHVEGRRGTAQARRRVSGPRGTMRVCRRSSACAPAPPPACARSRRCCRTSCWWQSSACSSSASCSRRATAGARRSSRSSNRSRCCCAGSSRSSRSRSSAPVDVLLFLGGAPTGGGRRQPGRGRVLGRRLPDPPAGAGGARARPGVPGRPGPAAHRRDQRRRHPRRVADHRDGLVAGRHDPRAPAVRRGAGGARPGVGGGPPGAGRAGGRRRAPAAGPRAARRRGAQPGDHRRALVGRRAQRRPAAAGRRRRRSTRSTRRPGRRWPSCARCWPCSAPPARTSRRCPRWPT